MKERPILFSGPMVRAILDGTKTQTRRVVKPQPMVDDRSLGDWRREDFIQWHAGKQLIEIGHECGYIHTNESAARRIMEQCCPYGQPGDRLWVRETFTDLRGTGIEHRPTPMSPLQRYAYAADTPPGSYSDEARKDFGVKWKPSIFMPREASRITLEVTGIRVERLQDISEADALAEGSQAPVGDFKPPLQGCLSERAAYRQIWDSINAKTAPWASNPWVWVVEFKRAAA